MAKNIIGDAIAATLGDVSTIDTSVQLIPLSRLKPNRRNFYPSPEFDALQELANSIIANGLLEPLTVTPDDSGDYRIISGHNRWRAMSLPNVRTKCPDLVAGVPCRVLPPMSEERELCAVIEANRQRVKNAATLAEEAEKLTEAYVARKKAGEDLPGRIRGRVAEALKVSASKLAMAQATREHLTLPGFIAQWKDGRIPDTVAYEISKMGGDHQYRLLDYLCDSGREAGSLTVAEVRALEEQFSSRPRKFDMTREKEDALFFKSAQLLLEHLTWDPSKCVTRTEAISELKKCNVRKFITQDEYWISCAPAAVFVRNGLRNDAPKIKRSWAEVYDCMALAALIERQK